MTELRSGFHDVILPLHHVGKVRETYEVPNRPDLLLVVATDRISTHNVVHESNIPHKGIVLTALTIHWLREVFPDLTHHLVAAGREIYQYLQGAQLPPNIHYRAIIVRKLRMSPVELIYRRHLVGAGSLYKAYQAEEDPYGLRLPDGLPVMHRFDPPIFTPTDKSETDEPLDFKAVQQMFPNEVGVAATAFRRGEVYLAEREIALLDSKFEAAGDILADEIITPDSSRFANLNDVKEGEDPPWLDKEFVRAEAVRVWEDVPRVPLAFAQEVISGTVDRYDNILYRITDNDRWFWESHELFDFHI